jgi:HK97 family phage major capsid protein
MSKTALMAGASARGLERKEDAPNLAAEVKKAVTPVMTAFEEFKAANDERLKQIEQKGAVDPTTEAKLQKVETELAKYEGLNQKLTQSEQQAKAANDQVAELKTQLEALQTTLRRGAGPVADPATRRAEQKALVNNWARGVIANYVQGPGNLTEDQKKAFETVERELKALSISNDTTGGYLAPAEFVADIIKGVTEISPARSLARLRTTANKSVQIPKRTGQFAARRTGETDTRTETTGLAWGMVEITAPEMYAIVDISEQNLEDSAFDLETEINMEATEQFAVREGYEFVNGVISKGEMEGILVNGDVASTNSGSATSIKDANGQADGLILLKHGIKSAYSRNATWAMNRTTLGSVRRLKDGQNQYIWMPGIALGKPNTIDGDPYVEMPDMPNEAAGATPIAYGDFLRAYTMLDRVAMQLLRDPFTQADSGLIRFRFRRRVGGQVVLAEAIRKLTCST